MHMMIRHELPLNGCRNSTRLKPDSRTWFVSLRQGFTIIELLVAIAIISVLMALILPAIQSARSAARRTQCKNNLRQIGIAMTATSHTKKRFPPAGTFSATGPEGYRNWVLELLPWIDKASLYDRWDFAAAHDAPQNREIARTGIAVLICPDDQTIVEGEGNLSFAVNGGLGWTEPIDCPSTMHLHDPSPVWTQSFDLNGNGNVCAADIGPGNSPSDREVFFMTGMFFVENEPLESGTSRHHTPDDIIDGLSNTILVAECVRSGFDPDYPKITGWSSPEPRRSCFFLSGYVCKDLTCVPGNVEYKNANNKSAIPQSLESLNSGLTQTEGRAPWPSSFHHGGLHMVFGDGSVRFVSEDVDGAVYAASVSPQGISLTGQLAQPVGTSLGDSSAP